MQDGLLLHYDGIRNAGTEAEHDANAIVWKNLGTGGASYDMVHGGAGYLVFNTHYYTALSKVVDLRGRVAGDDGC